MKPLFRLADNTRPNSLANVLRRRRFALFEALLTPLQRPVRLLDVGGEAGFWHHMGALERDDLDLTLLNADPRVQGSDGVAAVHGDAREMSQFGDREFDVVFSNSVIEHLGNRADQRRMANEIRRVGRRYFVQTPNRFFPLEPHFLVPGFQFLPLSLRVALVRRFALGYHQRLPDRSAARAAVTEIRLLDSRELRELFPGAALFRERLLGLTKSLVAYDGWDPRA